MRRLALSMLSTFAIGFLASLPAVAPSQVHLATTPAASASWLNRLNQWRTSTGVPNLTENTLWSQGDAAHSSYMVNTGLVTHSEDPANPNYTAAGDAAARNGNIQVSSTTSVTDDQIIDWWMAAPFHAMGMMDPRLAQTGFGSYRNGSTSPWQEGGTLDTLRGNSFSGGAYPVYYPGNGTTEPLTAYFGGEFPDPLQWCPGYGTPSGLPVFVQVGGNVNTTVGAHSFTGNGSPLNHCVIDSNTTGSLYARGGVILIPQQPLQSGVKYDVGLTVNGVAYTWSFRVGPFSASVTNVSPNAGPTAGGTTVTITGAGFSNGTTGVKFAATSAASFSVVNDTTVTAVSPAHAAGTFDVTVTTASGTTPSSSLDHFTFGACTSATASAAPASPSVPGTAVTFTAVASGCTNPLYQFWILAPGSSWVIKQAYSSGATFNWNTNGLPTGTYLYTVWVRDASSTGASCDSFGCKDALFPGTAYSLSTTAASCASVTGSPSPPSSATSGTMVAFTAAASGCSNPLYQFWTLAPGSTWQIAQAYSSNPGFKWDTNGLLAGTYYYTIWARDATSTGTSCNSYGCKDALVPGTAYSLTSTSCASVTASAVPASSAMPGKVITFTAVASGCANPLYQFWILAPGSSWVIKQAYSTSATFSWNTTGLSAGTYYYTIWVRDAGSSGTSCDSYGCKDTLFPGTAYSLDAPCTSVTASASPSSPQGSGTPITFSAVAPGCPNPLYQFWILAPGSSWQIVQQYSTAATFSWKTAGLLAGTYYYTIWARDASSSGTSCNSFGCKDALFPGTVYTLTSTPCTSMTASAAPASPQASSTPVTFTGVASGCTHPLYQFWILAPGSSWQIVQAYSTTPTFNWNTTGLPAGNYMYTVWVRDSGSAGTSCNSFGCKDALFPGTTYQLT